MCLSNDLFPIRSQNKLIGKSLSLTINSGDQAFVPKILMIKESIDSIAGNLRETVLNIADSIVPEKDKSRYLSMIQQMVTTVV
jgi:hypothetical protein